MENLFGTLNITDNPLVIVYLVVKLLKNVSITLPTSLMVPTKYTVKFIKLSCR